eukprot:CAMPEP_0118647572 /NCGR_PEP_ID=MMETSP0785-20121206/8681_1 /TAXON_ID=91992 /ORGANISM="Bolidomonas pacifica, Strain CCMP 1866" /LENGTH=806 /DNA_ID=CAMNT_0006539681 /DNA_START=76 /DNA_END=2492 /DNA_ORIENTATION=-
MSSKFSDVSAQEEFDLILPPGWTRSQAPDGNFIYYGPDQGSHLEHPLLYKARVAAVDKSENLPSGWDQHQATLEDSTTEVYYTNSALGLSMWDHPCLREELKKLVMETEEQLAEARTELPPPPPQDPQPNTPQKQKITIQPPSNLPPRLNNSPSSPSIYARGGVQKIQRMTPSKVKSSYFRNLENSARHPHNSPRSSTKQPNQSLGATSPTPQSVPSYSRSPHSPYLTSNPAAQSQGSSKVVVTGAQRFSQAEQASLLHQRLSKDIFNVNVMNHHRITEIRKICRDNFYFTSHHERSVKPPPPCFDVPTADPFSQMVKILQRSPKISAATLHKLFASEKYEDSARLSHLITHVLLNPFSTDQSLTTNFIIACIDSEGKSVSDEFPNASQPEFAIFVRPMPSGSPWDSSMMPLCANTSGTSLTQTLLCLGLRSDNVDYFRALWSTKLKGIYGSESKEKGTKAWERKRSLKSRDRTTILTIVRKLIDAVTTREALIKIPQTVVEVAYELESRYGRRHLDAYLLHYILLPVLPLYLCDPKSEKVIPPGYGEFSSIPECAVGWWDAFTGAVSPRQAQFVPGMTADQFEASFECPSWCGIVWVFWRVVQSSFDLGEVTEKPDKTMFGADIASAASGCFKKLKHYRSNIVSLSFRDRSRSVPVLDPSAFSKRMELLTPKCLEIVNLLVMSSGELKFMVPTFWQTLEAVVRGEEGGNSAAASYLVTCSSESLGMVGRLAEGCVYVLHLPVNDASNVSGVGGGSVLEGGGLEEERSDEGYWPKAPVPPPPPPLPTRSHKLLRKRESAGEGISRA